MRNAVFCWGVVTDVEINGLDLRFRIIGWPIIKKIQNDRHRIAFDRRLKVDTRTEEHDKGREHTDCRHFIQETATEKRICIEYCHQLQVYCADVSPFEFIRAAETPSSLNFLFTALPQSYKDIRIRMAFQRYVSQWGSSSIVVLWTK